MSSEFSKDNRLNRAFIKILQEKKKTPWYGKQNTPVWIGSIVAILTLIAITFQVKIADRQTKIFEDQTKIFEAQKELFIDQNKLFTNQNSKIDSQIVLFKRQNVLIDTQNFKTASQNNLISSQNKLLNFQNNRIDQQTNLQEAERRSAIVYLFNNVLDKIDEELKEKDLNGKERSLSAELIARIASLTQALKPYKYLDNDQIISRAVSPEKGQLLSALLNSNLSRDTYKEIFRKSNFRYSELEHADLRNIFLDSVDLSQSVFFNCNFSNSEFNNVRLQNAILTFSSFKNSKINRSDFSKSNMAAINGQNTEFQNCTLNSVNLAGSNLTGAIFKSNQHFKLELGQVLFGILSQSHSNLKAVKKYDNFRLIYGTQTEYIDSKNQKFYHLVTREFDINEMPFSTNSGKLDSISFKNADLTGSRFDNYIITNSEFGGAIITSAEFLNVSVFNTNFITTKLDINTFQLNFLFETQPSFPPIGNEYKLVEENFKDLIHFEIEGAIINESKTTHPYSHYLKSSKLAD